MPILSRTIQLVFLLAAVTAVAMPAYAVDTLYDQRFKEWTEGAEGGDPEAQYKLGNAYLRGTEVARDYDKAIEWFKKAAEQDHAKAQYKLGYVYYFGKGVDRDYSKAHRWLRPAANAGYSPAQFYMGKLYMDGNGVDRDRQKALFWLGKASKQNYTPADAEIKKVRAAIAKAKAERRRREAARREAARREARAEANKPKPRPKPEPAPEPEPEPEPKSFDTKALLLKGTFVGASGEPVSYMPSAQTSCRDANDEIICETGRMSYSTDYAKVNYKVRAVYSDFTEKGRFVVRHRRNNLFVLPNNPDDPTERSAEEIPPTGWEKVTKVLKCRFTDTDTIKCINDDFQREQFRRQ